MKKRPISIFDISIYLGGIQIIFTLGTLLFPFMKKTAMLIVIAVISLLIIYLISYIPTHRLPGISRYNPFNFRIIIEFHVGTSCKNNIKLLGRYFVDTLFIAKKKKQDIMFTSWFFKASTINNVFGDAAIIYKPSFPEILNGAKNKFKYRDFGRFIKKLLRKGPKVTPKSKPLITCVIKHEQINNELINAVKYCFRI